MATTIPILPLHHSHYNHLKKLPRRNILQYSNGATILINILFTNNYKCYFQLDLLLFTYILLYSCQPENFSNSLPLYYSRSLQARSLLVPQGNPACLTGPVLCSMFPHCQLLLYGNDILR